MQIRTKYLHTEAPEFEGMPADVMREKGLPQGHIFDVFHGERDPEKVGRFRLDPLPGCCGVVVSTDSFIEPIRRGSWVGTEFHEIKALVAKHYGYSAMLMTTQLRNIPEVVGASKAGWKFLETFRNTRTNNDLGVALKLI